MTDEDDGLTAELLDAICESIEQDCLPRKYAATANGISPKSLERMIVRGTTGEGSALHVALARRVHALEASKVGRTMRALLEASAEDGKAGETFLKLFKPGDFGGPKPAPDEFDAIERHAARRKNLWDAPPPRMLAEASEAGWWQLGRDVDEADRAVLETLRAKYRRAALPPGAPPAAPPVTAPPDAPSEGAESVARGLRR